MMTTATRPVKPLYRVIFVSGIAILSLVALIWVFPYVTDLFVMTLVSMTLMYVFRPGVEALERMDISRGTAVSLLFCVGGALVVGTVLLLFPLMIKEVASLSKDVQSVDLQHTYQSLAGALNRLIPDYADRLRLDPAWADTWAEHINSMMSSFFKQSSVWLSGLVNIFLLATVVPVLTFFMLKDGPTISKRLVEHIPNRYFEMSLSLMHRIDDKLGAYIRSLMVESLFIWLMTWPTLALLGVNFALVLGLLNGFLNMIPYFGPIIAVFPVAGVILITNPDPGWQLFWALVILTIIQIIDNLALKPLIVSRSMEVHPAVVLIGVLVGGNIAGAVGMFVAVPLYSVIQVIIVDLYGHLKKYKII